ncbi:MAG: deoxyguanosinetriphosphate triphosphohydrolase family protein [Clostridia bacterium]
MKNSFINYAATTKHANWKNLSQRNKELITNLDDIRSTFDRDYTRIIHCNAYRRLKHKTQVFFSPDSDHICTRSEHVSHVESISYTIANYFGLNTELTKAIAVAHDIGHSPFGHAGEKILSKISQRDLNCTFWHEKNGLDFVDKIELLEDKNNCKQNLNLTYAVRDGIISHCGEIDENALKPRTNYIDLSDYTEPNQYSPYTWEGCVVKISDKISYLGRDIEDAISLGIIDEHLSELYNLLPSSLVHKKINNTNIINYLVIDLSKNSSPEKGLCFSKDAFNLLCKIKDFNYKNIYFSDRLQPSIKFFELVINQIYDTLKSCYAEYNTLSKIKSTLPKISFKLYISFLGFLSNYYNIENRHYLHLNNDIIFDFANIQDFSNCIIYYISGMTDKFAIEIYNDIIGF